MNFSNSGMKMSRFLSEQYNGERNFLSTNINLNKKFNKKMIKQIKLKLFISKCA